MTSNYKILSLDALAEKLKACRAEGKKIVHCHGCFDLLHVGHIRYLEQAREMGDVLVVTLTPDQHVDKGPHRPAFTEALRAEAVASLSIVDFVAINRWPTAEDTLRLLRPHVYVKGSEFKNTAGDMTGKIGREEQVCREIGARLAFTEDIVFSSSNLINRFLSNFEEEIQKYLELFRGRYGIEDVFRVLDAMGRLKVLVIGDTILDEYQFCDAIGKSSKDPIIALKYKSHELFAGGVLAVANHIASFAGQIGLATVIGSQDSHVDFIRAHLNPNVHPRFFVQDGAPTVLKRRYLDGYTFHKLFEVYVMNDNGLTPETDAECREWLLGQLAQYDLVVAADFGHGAISDALVQLLAEKAPFLAVNTQANAGNRGFHTIARYPRADFVSIAEHEVRLETRDLKGQVRPMMESLARKMGCKCFVVTRGRSGCYVVDAQDGFVGVPSFAHKVVDRVGAGDAFFAVAAMAAACQAPIEMIGFIGNISGALAAETLGNQKAVDKLSVKKYITALMK